MRIAAYTRVSLERQASDEHYSLPEQADRIEAFCKAKGWNLVKIYTDAGYSGKNLDRPAIKQLIKECTLYDLVLVNKLDRLSRSQKDTLYLIEDVFRANGVQFASMSENFDTSTPLGMAMVGILSVFAQLEREQIKERLHMGRVGRAKKGLWRAGSNIPTGYDYVDGHLIVREDEAEQIRLIFDKFLAGESMHAISKYMHEHYKNRYSSYNTTGSHITSILRNRLYCGQIVFEGEIYDGDHEGIVSVETFEQAQRRYEQIMRDTPQYQNSFKAKHLLTGILFCGECGARYSTITNHVNYNKEKGTKNVYHYYGCRGKHETNQKKMKSNKCSNKYYRQEELDNAIIQEILKLDIETVKPKKIQPPSDNSKEIAKINKQISKLMDLYSIGGISLDDIKEKIDKLNAEKKRLTPKKPKKEPSTLSTKEIKSLISARDILLGDDLFEKRRIIFALIRKITLYKDHIDIEWNF